GYEAGNEDRFGPMAIEEAVELLHASRSKADLRTVALDQRASATAPDQKPQIIPERRAADRGGDYPPQRQTSESGERRAGKQRRLTWNRQPGVLQKSTQKHNGVPVAREKVCQPRGNHASLSVMVTDTVCGYALRICREDVQKGIRRRYEGSSHSVG